MVRFFLILSAIFLLAVNVNGIDSSRENNGEVTFLAFGHLWPDYEALELSIPLIQKEDPDFIVFLGDSVTTPKKNWPKLKAIIDKMPTPVYLVPGNHDILDKPEDKEYFKKNIGPLYQEFTIKNNTFILLNTAQGGGNFNDVSDEQVLFLESIYDKNDNDKFIFMHHCLFYKDNNKLCNCQGHSKCGHPPSKGYYSNSKNTNWNKMVVPVIQDKISGVFVGDVGAREPYFSYREDNVPYFGVGFSSDMLRLPQHMLKGVIANGSLTVTTIPIRNDLTTIEYDTGPESFTSTIRTFIIANLKSVLIIFLSTIAVLLLIILWMLRKFETKKK